MWWFAVVCGGLRWFVVVCGGFFLVSILQTAHLWANTGVGSDSGF